MTRGPQPLPLRAGLAAERCAVGEAQGQGPVVTKSPGRRGLLSKVAVGPAGPSGAGRAGASSGRLRRLPRRRGPLLPGHPACPSLPIRGPAAAALPAHGPQRGRMGRGGGAPVWSIDPTSPPPARPDWAGRTPRLPALAPARAWPGSRRGHTPLRWPCSAGSRSRLASALPPRSFPASLAVAQGQRGDRGFSFLTPLPPSNYPRPASIVPRALTPLIFPYGQHYLQLQAWRQVAEPEKRTVAPHLLKLRDTSICPARCPPTSLAHTYLLHRPIFREGNIETRRGRTLLRSFWQVS